MIMGFLMFIFIVSCVLLTVIILLQSSEGEGLASGVFGGMGAQSLLGGRGATTFLSKLTTGLAIVYIVLSVILARFYGGTTSHKINIKPEAQVNQTDTSKTTTKSAAPAGNSEESTRENSTNKEK